MLYIVTAHRWGWLNDGMYHVWAGDDQARAEEIAAAEVIGRGDKYGCQVLRCIEGAEEMEFERVAYFPSGYGERVPYYSPHIAMHEDLGRLVRDAVTQGSINIADPENPIYSKSVAVDVPQWLTDQVTRRMALAATEDDARRSGKVTES